MVGPGKVVDTNRYYVVFLDALGLWGASGHSDGLGRKFPAYSYFDMVQSNYRMLRDHLKIAQVEVATGVSMGATQSWVWGVMHSPSGFVKAIMPIGGTTASDGADPVGAWTFLLGQAAIESDPMWRKTNGNYYDLPVDQHPKRGLQFMWSRLQLTGLTFPVRTATPWDQIEREVFHWEPKGNQSASWVARVKSEDPVDFWYRNDSGFNYNINQDLKRIKARTLVVHVENDMWLLVANARQAAKAVDGAVFASFADRPRTTACSRRRTCSRTRSRPSSTTASPPACRASPARAAAAARRRRSKSPPAWRSSPLRRPARQGRPGIVVARCALSQCAVDAGRRSRSRPAGAAGQAPALLPRNWSPNTRANSSGCSGSSSARRRGTLRDGHGSLSTITSMWSRGIQ